MLGVFALAGIAAPGLIAHPSDGVVQAVVSGLSVHAPALITGYALVLGSLAYRARKARRPISAPALDSRPASGDSAVAASRNLFVPPAVRRPRTRAVT